MDDHNDTHPAAVGLVNRATGAAIDLSDDIADSVSDGDVLEATNYNLTLRDAGTSFMPDAKGFDQKLSSLKQDGFSSLENAREKLNRGIAVMQQNLQQNLYTADQKQPADTVVGSGPAVITSIEQAEEELRRWEEKKAQKIQAARRDSRSQSPVQWVVKGHEAPAGVRFLEFSAKSPVSEKDRSKSTVPEWDRSSDCDCGTPKAEQRKARGSKAQRGRQRRSVGQGRSSGADNCSISNCSISSISPTNTGMSSPSNTSWSARGPIVPEVHVVHPLAAALPAPIDTTAASSPAATDASSAWKLLQSTIGTTKEKLQSTIGTTKEKVLKQMGAVEVQLQQKQDALNSATAKMVSGTVFERVAPVNEPQKENAIPAWARQQTPENLRCLEEENIHGSKSRLAAAAAMIQWPNMRRNTSPQLNDILDCFDES
jgi:hypothetical protein